MRPTHLLLCLLYPLCTLAQETPSKLQFSTYYLEHSTGHSQMQQPVERSALYFHNGQAIETVTLKPGQLSKQRFTYAGPIARIPFYASDPTVDGTPPQPLLTTTFSTEWEEALVLFYAGEQAMEALTIPSSLEEIPAAGLRLLNMGPTRIHVSVNGQTRPLEPLQAADFGPLAGSIAIQVLDGDEPERILYSSKLFINERTRLLALPYKPHAKRNYWNLKQIRLPQ